MDDQPWVGEEATRPEKSEIGSVYGPPAHQGGGRVFPKLIGRVQWGASAPAGVYPLLGKVTQIVLHHTQTPDDDRLTAAERTRQIQFHHQSLRWSDIGYHLLIGRQGEILVGRPLWAAGAHAGKGKNKGRLGIAMIGHRVFTPWQMEALDLTLTWASALFGLAPDQIVGHDTLTATDCPGPVLTAFLACRRRKRD